ncbi:MAG: redoxin domain-containing protein [Bacteroidia bacterium]|nr:redoxin domain-containing protein [Bacteroidia bacterium]
MKRLALSLTFVLSGFICSSLWAQGETSTSKAYLYIFLEEECPMCQYYSLTLRALHDKYAKEGISFTGLFPFSDSRTDKIQAFKEKYQFPFELKLDENQALARLFEAQITPEVVLTNAEGEIIYRGRIDNAYDRPGRRRRVITKHELEDALDDVLAGRDPEISRTQAVGCFISFQKP